VPCHCAIFYFALEAVSYYEVVPLTPLAKEARDFGKIVTAVRIAQNDEVASSLCDPFAQRTSIAFYGGVHYASSMTPGDLYGAVAGTVVSHYDLAINAMIGESSAGLIHTTRNGSLFV
jgi:hypothetical protein